MQRGRAFRLLNAPVTSLGLGFGGFAEFSGAKFSLLPAGTGLIAVAGSEPRLRSSIDDVIAELGLSRFRRVASKSLTLDAADSLKLRPYDSYVLTPEEITNLVTEATRVLPPDLVTEDRVSALSYHDGAWEIQTEQSGNLRAQSVVFAGGRTGANLLASAGAIAQPGRGLDLGVRLEFSNRDALAALRALGADAKLLSRNCRTFCLNYPGEVFHYPTDEGILIPGGVVAEASAKHSNVGLLCRVKNKQQAIERFKQAAERASHAGPLSYKARGAASIIDAQLLEPFYGSEVVKALSIFVTELERSGLVRLDGGANVHYPLVDWHWQTFALGSTFRTSAPGLFVVGDLAGHARGLLQSAVSGWLAAEEL